MTIKRLILSALTFVAIVLIGTSLAQSWNEPQVQSRLELYQANLILHAAEWNGSESGGGNPSALFGGSTEAAIEQYQELRDSAQKNLSKAKNRLQQAQPTPGITPEELPQRELQQQELRRSVEQLTQLQTELDLRLGILQAHQNKPAAAVKTWQDMLDRPGQPTTLVKTAETLIGLWSNPAQLLPNAEVQLKGQLDGWFRYQALSQLYQLQERQQALVALQATEQTVAQQAAGKLAIVSTIPLLGGLAGVVLLLVLLVQFAIQRDTALLAIHSDTKWSVPWDGETIWQVVLGFFLVGQILLPLVFSVVFQSLRLNPAALGERGQGYYVLASYALLSMGGLGVLYTSIAPFFPLPKLEWFNLNWRSRWWLWGLGGYLVALPLVILVSWVNQQLWQGQGGSNPILQIALEGKDPVALAIFCFTASIAAPLYEEVMFRGFLLPSLTRYLPVWGAIVLSGFVFAVAHLNVSEILPLAVLGIVMGFVYTRSRSLLASMLLHSLWNSGTLLSLFLLGRGSN